METHTVPVKTAIPSMPPCTYTKEDARAAVDKYFDLLSKAIKSIPTGGVPFSENLKRYSEMNVETAREYMHQLGQAKHFAEVLRIQAAFALAQYNAFNGQSRELRDALAREEGRSRDQAMKNVA